MASTTKTTKAVKKATELKISTVGDFKKRLGGLTELPSGMVVRLSNPGGLAAFMGTSAIPNGLMPLVTKQLKASKGDADKINEEDLHKELENDPKLLQEMTVMIDHVAIRCIVEPQCHPTPKAGVERDEDLLYVDEIPMMDKQFVFSWLTTGVKDLEPFRK